VSPALPPAQETGGFFAPNTALLWLQRFPFADGLSQLRLWQAIGLIAGKHLRRSERIAELAHAHLFSALEAPNFRNVRIVIELCGANYFLLRPDTIHHRYLEYVQDETPIASTNNTDNSVV
jgi:hypothetical protein